MTKCCVIGCKNIGIHKFPINPIIRRKWIAAVRIKNFEPTKTTRLCRDHFHKNDYKTLSVTTGLPCAHKFLKIDAVPSIFSWNQKRVSASARARDERHAKRNIQKNLFHDLSNKHLAASSDPQPSTSTDPQPSIFTDSHPSTSQDPQYIIEYQRELEISSIDTLVDYGDNVDNQITKSVATQTATMLSLFSTDNLLSDDESVKFYTGLENNEKFKFVLSTLLPMANHLKYRWCGVSGVSTEDQFIMMLIKLRRASPDLELSKMFGVSKTQVSNIFITWVNFVNDLWSMIDIWPQRDLVNFYMPAEYKENKMPTRVIIDCTEIPITKPSDPKSQQITFSSYKNKNTIKFLVGSTPGGLLSYCSEGFGGSISDRQMIERSKLLKLCDEGDSIMADRGFNVQDLFASKNIGINIPSFLRGKAQLPGLALLHDRKIASQRVHIERLIGLTKTYKILKTELNAYYVICHYNNLSSKSKDMDIFSNTIGHFKFQLNKQVASIKFN